MTKPTKEEIKGAMKIYLEKNTIDGVSCQYDEATDRYLMKDRNNKETVVGPGWACSDEVIKEALYNIMMDARDAKGEPTKSPRTEDRPPAEKIVPQAAPKSTQPHVGGFRKAERKKAKLRLGISGPSGSGKTASALLIAYGICGDWEKIGVIDTESNSAELYVGQTVNNCQIGVYNVLSLGAPYTPDKYIQAIKAAEEVGFEVVIIDSLTHAWAGEGGLLDQHGKIADSGKGNSWTAWRTVTPKHNALVEAMLTSKIHLIATIRAKTDYVQEKDDKGRTTIKKVGLAPIQREGIEYEMTTFLDLDINHQANASKDRANLFPTDAWFKPGTETGKKLKAWLEATT